VIDSYVKAYQTAEPDERVARKEQLSDAELMRIAMAVTKRTSLALCNRRNFRSILISR
jgi:hypothetical protein